MFPSPTSSFGAWSATRSVFPAGSSSCIPQKRPLFSFPGSALRSRRESQGRQPGRYFMLKAYVTQMILLLYREQAAAPSAGEGGYEFESTNKRYVVEQIIDYLDNHYNEKISLDQIARNMYLSPFYISKIFKSETGDTPINHLIRGAHGKGQGASGSEQKRQHPGHRPLRGLRRRPIISASSLKSISGSRLPSTGRRRSSNTGKAGRYA